MSVSPNHSMARHNDGHRILAIRQSYSSRNATHSLGFFLVGNCLSEWDTLKCLPRFDLKRCSDEADGNIELGPFPIEILIKLPDNFWKRSNFWLSFCLRFSIAFPPKMEPDQIFSVRN